jgi:hypothetical protein
MTKRGKADLKQKKAPVGCDTGAWVNPREITIIPLG